MKIGHALPLLISALLLLGFAAAHLAAAAPAAGETMANPSTLPDGEQLTIDGDLGFSIRVLFNNGNFGGRATVTLIHGDSSVADNGQIMRLNKGYTLTWRGPDGQTYKIAGQPAIALRTRDDPRGLDFAFTVDSLDGVPQAMLDRRAKQVAHNKSSVFASGRLPAATQPAAAQSAATGAGEGPYVIWMCKLRVIVTSTTDLTLPTGNAKVYSVSAPSVEFLDWGA